MVVTVEGPAKAVILQLADLLGLQAEVFWHVACEPLGKSIQGAACQQEIGDQDAECDGGGDLFGAPGGRRQVACEERR
jgi:hypothetical protein